MALTTDEQTVMRELVRAKVLQGSDSALDATITKLRTATEAEMRTAIQQFASTKSAEIAATITGWSTQKTFYDSVVGA